MAFAFCWLEMFQYHKCIFGIGFELTLYYYDSCKNRQCKTISPSPSSTGELLLPQDLDWSLIFDSFLSRYPSNTDNQIYSNSKTRIWNPILLVLVLCAASFQIYLWISLCSSMLCSLSFEVTSENFEFRWSITGLILKALSVLLSFLLSAKCRFWRISEKPFRINGVLNTVITDQIIYSPVFSNRG